MKVYKKINNPGVEGYLMPNMHVCMYVWMDACMDARMDACMDACMYGCMYVCVCMYACMHACMHACIYTYIWYAPKKKKIHLLWFVTGIYVVLQQVCAFLQNLIFEEG